MGEMYALAVEVQALLDAASGAGALTARTVRNLLGSRPGRRAVGPARGGLDRRQRTAPPPRRPAGRLRAGQAHGGQRGLELPPGLCLILPKIARGRAPRGTERQIESPNQARHAPYALLVSNVGPEEYARLSDQKAKDWRSVSNVNPTLFGVAGVIFAAGVAEENAVILALRRFPCFSVFHMIRNAKLQMQMITYLGRFVAPRAVSV